MPTVVTLVDKWYDGERAFAVATITFSGTYVPGGDTLSIAGLVPGTSLLPVQADHTSQATTAAQALNAYLFLPGATQATCKIRVFNGSSAELTAIAYPAAITGDSVQLQLTFKLR